MKIRLLGYAYSIFIASLLLLSATEVKAQYKDTVTYDYGSTGSCVICGSGYTCFTSDQKTLVGNSGNLRISSIKVKVFHTSCGSGDFYAVLNGDTLGSFTRSYSCSCSDCFIDSFEADYTKLGSYLPNSNNTIWFGGLYTCTDRIMVIRTYTTFASNDAGIFSIDSPIRVCPGSRPISIKIANYGQNVLDSVKINWTYNGIAQTPYNYIGLLDTLGGSNANKALITLGYKTLVSGQTDALKVWTTMPNGIADTSNYNDTLYASIKPSLGDTLTVGGSSPDYTSIQDAIDDMMTNGICSKVVVDIRPGVYTEQLNIGPIPGSDSIKHVVFRSSTGDSSDVTINFSASNSTSNYVVLLNNAKHIHFKQLTFEAGGTTYARVFEIRTGFRNIHIKNSLIMGYSNSGSSTNQALLFCPGSVSANSLGIYIDHTEWIDGSYGLYITASGNYSGLQLTNSMLIDQKYCNIFLNIIDNVLIKNNEITRINTPYSYGYGIYLYDNQNVRILNNHILQPTGAYGGIYTEYVRGSSNLRNLIANNFISVGGNTYDDAWAWYAYDCSYMDYYNNSSYSKSLSTNNGAISISYGNNHRLRNNSIVYDDANGYLIYNYYSSTPNITASNNNNFYSPTLSFYRNNPVIGLSLWRSGTGLDSASSSENPGYRSTLDLHAYSADLDGSAIVDSRILTDIDGESRNSTNPDIGADEFNLVAVDAGITSILPYTADSICVKVKVKNHGEDTLVSAQINWRINGINKTAYSWTGSLATGKSAEVCIGFYKFSRDTIYTVQAWTSSPNSQPDTMNFNDTAIRSGKPAMRGIYTIGGSSPNFASFTAAINAMQDAGIIDSVLFKVRNGTYNEKLVIPQISGANRDNAIVFESENKDSSLVTLSYATSWSEYEVVHLDGAQWVGFRHMTIKSSSSFTPSRVFTINNEAAHINISRNRIESNNTSSTDYYYDGLIYTEETSDVSITRNHFKNGASGLYVSFDEDISVKGNLFQDAYYMGVHINEAKHLTLSDNKIWSNSSYTDHYGVNIDELSGVNTIAGNTIISPDKNEYAGMYIDYIEASISTDTTYIYNNNISSGGNSQMAFYIYNCENTYITNNNIHIYSDYSGTTWAGRFYYPYYSHIYNNNFIASNSGIALEWYSPYQTTEDYNNYSSNGATLYSTNGNPYTNLADLQSDGYGANSLSVNPSYNSNTDLHVQTINLNESGKALHFVKKDIDGEIRSSIPDIGSDEFEPKQRDASVLGFINPGQSISADTTQIKVIVGNFGLDSLRTFKVRCIVNKDTFSITVNDTLASGDTVHVSLGNYVFKRDSVNNLKAWTYEPNNGSDQKTSNDTFKIINRRTAMSGVYTIGGSTPHFPNFKSAINAMYLAGISGNVRFRVRSGVYSEQLKITPIPGVNGLNSVVFESESLDSSNVILRYNSTYYDTNYVVFFKGASGITFRHMTIQAMNSNYGTAFLYEDGANLIVLNNNIIKSPAVTTSSSYNAVISSMNSNTSDEYNQFQYNVIENGSYGIYWYGYGVPVYEERGTVIQHNIFKNQYYMGLYLREQRNINVHANSLFSNSTYTSYYGFYFDNISGKGRITANVIDRPNNGYYGMYFSDVNGNGDTILIANNIINMGGSSSAMGMYLYYNYYTHIVHNTIRINNSANSSSACLYQEYGLYNHLLNNILENTSTGYAAYFANSSAYIASDNNNFRSAGSSLVYWNNTPYTALSSFKTASGRDNNSLSVDPMFYSSSNLHIKQIDLNGSAKLYPAVKTDFEGNIRDTSKRDIGADEFNPPALDAGILAVENPKTPFQPDTQYVKVALKNFGMNTITSVNIYWVFNDTTQATYNWTGSLISNDTVHVLLALKYFDPDSNYSVKAWTSLPNSYNDTVNYNDTASSLNLYPALSGIYTIGGANPDFINFTDAITALKRGGIIDQVTFNVRNGTYTEKLLIPAITGAGARNSIIFQSENQDSTKVTLVNNSNSSGINYTVKLNGGSGITFRWMTISSGNTTYGRVIEMDNGSSFNTFTHNILETVATTQTGTNMAVVMVQTSNTKINVHNQYLNNVFKNGSYGIYEYGYATGNFYNQNTVVSNNIFESPYYTGVYLAYSDTTIVHNNQITVGTYSSAFGIRAEYGRGKHKITSNTISVPNGYMGIYAYNFFSSSNHRSLIANNMVSVLGNGGNYGLYFYGSYVDVYYNNFHLNSSNSNSYAAMYTSSSNVRSVNNIYSNSGTGFAMYTSSASTITESNYNCYRTGGSNLAYWNGNRSDLSALRTANAKDGNSISIDPLFVSNSDLHVRAIGLNKAARVIAEIKTDIDGRNRDTLSPDIGADEFDIPSPNDAGISKYIGPLTPFASGSKTVSVVLTNYGSDTLKSATIHWTMNGSSQTAYSWTGSIKSGASDTVDIGSFNFTPGTIFRLKTWPVSPNGITDTINYNDSFTRINIMSALDGIYTIGGSVPDFATFTDARDAMMIGGVIDTVTFKVRNGTYDEQVQFLPYPGASASRPVTFTSESRDSSKVILQNNNYNYVVSLKGADYLTFSHITIKNIYYYGGSVVTIDNGATNNTFKNNRIQVTPTYYYYYNSIGFLSGSDRDDNTKILNNAITGTTYAIQLYGGGSSNHETGLVIEGNKIDDCRGNGIYLLYMNAAQVKRNQINFASGYGSYGIYQAESSNDLVISHNKINVNNAYGTGIYINYHQGTSAKRGLILNNFVSVAPTYYQGIYLNNTNYINMYYNSVNMYGTALSTSAPCLHLSSASNLDLRNNILSNLSGTYALITNSIPTTCNYNNLYTSGSNLCQFNSTNYSSLSSWRTGVSRDANSKSVNPTFFSNTDLHTTLISLDSAATPISGVTDDIDGNTRNNTRPDIGADEFNSLPNNLSVTAISNPVSGCEIDSQQLRITIFNFGSNVQKNFPVRYKVNGGSTVSETFTDSILPGTAKTFNFSGKVNTNPTADYQFVVWTDASSEQYRLNDTIKTKVSNYQTPAQVGTMIPADSTKNLAFPFSLSWTPSSGATLYDIYVWADSISTRPSSPLFSNQTQISRQITGGLGYGVTYKWQVIAKNPSCSTDGPLQRFTIRNLPDLVARNINAPSSSFSGNSISVSWTIKNNGSGTTGSTGWYDLIYLSSDQILDGSDLQMGGVLNLTSLNPNQSYNNSANITLPEGISNTYHILIRTDAYGYLTESNEGNNINSDSAGMIVSLTPPPDLRVISLIKPKLAFSGNVINLQYQVKNIGSGPSRATSWRDYIYLNDDSSQGGTYIKTIQRNGALEVDSSYTVNTTMTLPMTISGRHYIYIKTDALNQVYEHASESNNGRISDTMYVILTPPPDLIVKNLSVTDTASNREIIAVNYNLINQGGTTTTHAWYDYIFVSKFYPFNYNSSTSVGAFYRANLTNDDTQTISQNITVPDNITGPYYLYVYTDMGNSQFEGVNDSNNISSPANIRVLNPDLVTRHVIAPSSDTTGNTVRIDWFVKNNGQGKNVNEGRYDYVYISRHPTYHPDSVTLLGSNLYSAALNPGDSIARSKMVVIPNGMYGNRYFYVMADAQNHIFENNKDSNNTARSQVANIKLAPYPDLRATVMNAPDSSDAGLSTLLSYTVVNKGNRSALKGWKDKIYVSKDSIYNVSKVTLLQTVNMNSTLAVDSSYQVSQNVTLPATISAGNYYFYVFADANDDRYEFMFENNNIKRSKKIHIDGYPPIDLMNSLVTMPDTAYSGNSARISWKVKNIGDAVTIAPNWTDRVYLSLDTILDGSDKLIGETQVLIPLKKDSSYSRNLNFNIPNGISGEYVVIVKSDVTNNNNDEDTLNNIAYSVNGVANTRKIRIILSKSSDLQITSWTIPSTGIEGQPASIIWKVENKGDTSTKISSWNDRVYLSTDYTIGSDDVVLGNSSRNGKLNKNASYLDTGLFTIPSNITGNYIVMIKTDEADREYEHNAENNNTVSSVMTISSAPPGDLIVSSVSAPATAVAGTSLNVSYQIKNIGSNPVNGWRTDNIYLSDDSLFDATDVLFATKTDYASLVTNASKNMNATAVANGIKTGTYYFIVYTDVKDNINESRDTNNTGYSAEIEIAIPELPLNVEIPDTLKNNNNMYYRLIIPDSLAGESVLITLKGDSVNGHNEMYARLNDVPTRSQFDFGFSSPYEGNQEILIPEVSAGTYYLLIYGNTSTGNQQNVKLFAKKLNFEIRKVTPIIGGNTGQVTLKIEGSKFDINTVFKLSRPGSEVLMNTIQIPDSSQMIFGNLGSGNQSPRSIVIINPTLAYVTFNLRGQALGLYDVTASKSIEEVTLKNGFTIVAGSPPDIDVSVLRPSSTRANAITSFQIMFKNSGNTDMVNGFLEIVSNGGAPISLTPEGLSANLTRLFIPLEEFNSIEGLLRPGGSGSVTIYTLANTTLAFNILTP